MLGTHMLHHGALSSDQDQEKTWCIRPLTQGKATMVNSLGHPMGLIVGQLPLISWDWES